MKFFSWLGVILVLLLIIATVTVPGDKKFIDFINKDKGGDTMRCRPVIGNTTQIKLLAKFATINYVSYCESMHPINVTDQNGQLRKTNISIPKMTHSEKYLGLFGRFWKL